MTYHNFTLHQVTDGIWATLSGVNAGIVDLGDQTLIFDTMANLGSGQELRAAAEALTGRTATYVINSHGHADHFNGNLAFAHDAVLIASAATRDLMVTGGVTAIERLKSGMVAQADGLRRQLAAASDEAERAKLQAQVADYDAFFAAYPTPDDLRLPTLAYERQLTFHGSKRTAHLLTFGGAHSPCDAVLWLPDDGVLFTGDLVVPGDNLVLWGGGANPDQWLPIVDRLEALGARTLVPGHRKIVPAAEGYAWVRQYVTEIFGRAAEAAAAGLTAADVEQIAPPAGLGAATYRRNLAALLERRQA